MCAERVTTLFAAMAGADGFAKRAFAASMERLFQAGKIVQQTDGPPSKPRVRIVRKAA